MPYNWTVSFDDIMNLYIAHHRDGDREGIKRAYKYADEKHAGVLRGSGEPYICHPLRTARLLAERGFDSDCLIAALLHDVVEDCNVPLSEIRSLFGRNVSETVNAVTALSDKDFGEKKVSKKVRDAMSDAKLLREATRNALYVKTADRIDNLYTISGVKEEKRILKAEHTREILIPLVEKLQAYYYVDILEELCFGIEHPARLERMKEIRDRICLENQLAVTGSMASFLQVFDPDRKTPDNALEPYRRHIIRFFQQDRSMVSLSRQITKESENVNDLESVLRKDAFAFYDLFLIVSNDLEDEGTMIRPHDLFFRYFDLALSRRGFYIISYKKTTHGDASYFLLADEMENLYRLFIRTEDEYDRYLYGNIIDNPSFSVELVNELEPRDTFTPKIKVFCRDGAAMMIDRGSTVLDFAFHIHTDLGLHFKHAWLNESRTCLPAYTRLNEGDQVEIVEDENVTPSLAWFRYIRTSRAADRLVHYFEQLYADENGRAFT